MFSRRHPSSGLATFHHEKSEPEVMMTDAMKTFPSISGWSGTHKIQLQMFDDSIVQAAVRLRRGVKIFLHNIYWLGD